MPSPFINDGYTDESFIKEMPNVHPECRFKFRPATADERYLWREQTQTAKAKEAKNVSAKLLAGKLVSWSFDAEIKPEIVGTLKPALFERMLSIVLGMDGGDDDPNREQESDLKNSSSG